MPKKNSRDVLAIFAHLKKVLETKPPIDRMYEEVRMMKFKIRPIAGDITLLQLKNNHFIETLWSLGKLDEMFQKEFNKLSNPEKEVFFRMFDNLHQQFQGQLNKLSVNPQVRSNIPQILEIEIFKEMPARKKLN